MSEGEEKTEEPTAHKLNEARKKGQVAKSTDVVSLFSLAFAAMFLAYFMHLGFARLMSFFTELNSDSYASIDPNMIAKVSRDGLDLWLILSLPCLMVAGIAAICGNVSQFGFLISSHPLKPDIKKINPVSGLKKMFGKDRAVEFFKQIIKFSAVFLVVFYTVKNELFNLSILFRVDLMVALSLGGNIVFRVVVKVLLCFLIIAVFDLFWQRFSFKKSMRMSKYEVKKEYKQNEGDPQLKGERKRVHQESMESMSVGNVSDASVVITNPSHIAVALKYDGQKDQAPIIIAKGTGPTAKEIIREANSNEVAVIRNVPLARDLNWLELNEEIPQRMYDAVAEVLIFVHELNRKPHDGAEDES